MNDGLLLFLALLALGGFIWFAASFAAGMRAGRWPTERGRILAADIEPSGTTSRRGPWAKPLYVPRVRYEYIVRGRSYRGERTRFGGGGNMSREDALAAVRAWAVGSAVEVAYDPRDPHHSTLERGADAAHAIWATGCAVAALVLLGGYMGWFSVAR
jgi:hypothetical protein